MSVITKRISSGDTNADDIAWLVNSCVKSIEVYSTNKVPKYVSKELSSLATIIAVFTSMMKISMTL